MNIIIPIKQVPDTANISIDPLTNTLIRKSSESIINPFDLHSLELGVKIKEELNAQITAISMGPVHAKNALIESLSRGADQAVLITDKKFGGADTLATSYTLYKAIKKNLKYDIIICGRQAIDGDTAQVGPELSEFLNIPLLTNVTKIIEINKNFMIVEISLDSGYSELKIHYPFLLTVTKNINVPRLVNLENIHNAINSEIIIYDSNKLNTDDNMTGLKGSPTKVKKISRVEIKKNTIFIEGNPDKIAFDIIKIINNKISENNKNIIDVELLPENKTDKIKNIFIMGEDNDYIINRSSCELSYIAKKLALKNKAKIFMIFAADNPEKIISNNLMPDVHKLFFLKNKNFNKINIEIIAEEVQKILLKFNTEIFLGTSSVYGRALLPLIAVKLKTGLTADCTDLDIDEKTGLLQQTRPAYGGNITALIETQNKIPQMATVRANVFPCVKKNNTNPQVEIIDINNDSSLKKEIIKTDKYETKDTDLADSDIIISGGRGIGGKEGFKLLNELSDLLNAKTGGSRSAVDAGWISYNHQIGQTGKTVMPKIYIACGISGAIQHMAGMQSSDIIISINKDKNAPIFNISDYAVVSDYKLIINEIIKNIKEQK